MLRHYKASFLTESLFYWKLFEILQVHFYAFQVCKYISYYQCHKALGRFCLLCQKQDLSVALSVCGMTFLKIKQKLSIYD